jgi:hypothetical protein
MSTEHIRIDLTKEQQAQIKQESGRDIDSIDLGVELEQRIAPVTFNYTSTQVQYKSYDP